MSYWVRAPRPIVEARSGWSSPAMTMAEAFSIGGETYDSVRMARLEDALRSVAVRSSVDLIASLGGELPLTVFTGLGPDRQKRTTPGYLEDPAGDGHGRADWSYQALTSFLVRGNIFGEVLDASPLGFPRQVDLWHPDAVHPQVQSDGTVKWSHGGKPVERMDRFYHRRVNPVPGALLGKSVIDYHAWQLTLPLSAQLYGLQWFRDGAHPSGILSSTTTDMTTLDDSKIKLIKGRFIAGLRGRRDVALVGKGWTFDKLQVSPDESQFLATMGFSEAQCCRIFGPGMAEILGYESGGTLTYANVESRASHLLIFAVGKWLSRLERLFTQMLPASQYAVLDRDAILSSTTLARYQTHQIALTNRFKTINEVRAQENLPPVAWGDEPDSSQPAQPAGGASDTPNGSEAPPALPSGRKDRPLSALRSTREVAEWASRRAA